VVVAVSGPDAHPRPVAEGIAAALRDAGYTGEFVFVLDGPAGAVVKEIAAIDCGMPVKLLQLQGGGLGESIALSAGVAKAEGQLIVNVPPYLQMEPADVSKVLAALEAGADCVATWRAYRVDPWLNQLQSRFFNWVLRLIMGMPFHDLNSGTRGFRRQVLEEVAVYGELYRFLPVLARRQGFRVVEVKVRHREEKGRAGFYGVGVYVRRLLDILAITFLTRFTQRPLRFFGYLGFAAMLLGAALVAYPLYLKLTNVSGLSDSAKFIVGSILGAFGVQLIGFGLIGEIIIFTQAPNLRDYKVEELIEGGAEHPAAAVPANPPPEPPAPKPEPPEPSSTGTIAVAVTATVTTNGSGTAYAEPRQEDLPLRVRELQPGEDSRFDAYVTRHPQGTFFHLTGWRRATASVFHHAPHYLVVEQGRRWLGVLPLFRCKSPFLGRNLVSVPYAVYGGVLAETEPAQAALLDHAAVLGRSLRCGYVEMRHLEQRPGERPSSSLYVTFRKELPEDPAAVMPSIPKRARAEVRRAREKFGIVLRADCDLGLFFELFAENKRRLGSPAYPLAWFTTLQEEFGKAVQMHRAVDPQGRTLAAVMSFCFRDTLCAYYSGSRTGVNDTGVMNYLYCAMMEWAAAAGYTRFDFGRSRADSGPGRFKANMGFVAEPLHYEYLLLRPGSKLPDFHPSNPRLDLPRRIWSNMPVFVANRLGARLSRYLP
jgi:FemAB-related protein (PEP-CTERM system-associated)